MTYMFEVRRPLLCPSSRSTLSSVLSPVLMFVGAGEYLQVLGSGVGCVAAAAAAVGGERRVCQSSSPASHGEEDRGSVLSIHDLLTWSVSSEEKR